ncbi:MAG: chorismate-binding protein [Cyclobacteriaceae bacterium]
MEIVNSIEHLAKEPERLIKKLIPTGYPFALWRSPNSEKAFLMIDIISKSSNQIRPDEWSIENTSECFVINNYSDSHPPTPQVIRGNLILTIEDKDVQLSIDPKASSSDLESFMTHLNKSEIESVESNDAVLKESSDFEESVKKAIDTINESDLQKVVLSRFKDFDVARGFKAFRFFRKISANYPNAFCYIVSSSNNGVWIGATPERLLTIREEKNFTTDALAGTQKIQDNTSLANIAWTQKEIEEQAMVSRYIIDCFKKIRLREFEEHGPKTAKAGNLAHLKTSFKVDMKATNTPDLGSIMLDLLHPTSAVCGFPRAMANQFIKENEQFDRELFTGFLGPVNFQKETLLYVNLRCMKVEGNKVRLFAGAGITADSDPKKEFEETQHKMGTLLSVLETE